MAFNTARFGRQLTTPGGPSGDKPLRQRIWAARWCYLFMIPNLVLATLFTLYPTVMSWYFSFLDWSGFAGDREWIGLANFREIVRDDFFWDAYVRSFLFMLVGVPIKVVLALVLALILNDAALKLAPVFRTLFFLPVVTSAAIVGIVMTFVFSPFNGPINQTLLDVGIVDRPVDFLGDPDTALWSVVAVWIWKSAGVTMIYWLAALQIVPQDLYEAARIDGANRWQLHRNITLPMIIPFAAVILLISIVGALNVFGLVQTMTGGGPFFASEVVEVYIYRTAFGAEGIPRLGYASAAALFFGLTVLALSLLQGGALRKANAARAQMRTQG
ncbi:MAG: carbohydrate ABC transporter permease [Thermomicrobiales bacterium]